MLVGPRESSGDYVKDTYFEENPSKMILRHDTIALQVIPHCKMEFYYLNMLAT